MKGKKVSPGNLFKKEKQGSEVTDILVERLGVSLKAARKISKHVNIDRLREFEGKDSDALKDMIAGSTLEIKKVTEEVENNEQLKAAQEVIKTLKGGLRETVEPFKASIALASVLLEIKNANQD